MRLAVNGNLHLLEMIIPILTVSFPDLGIFTVQRFAEAKDIGGIVLLHILNIIVHTRLELVFNFGLNHLYVGRLGEIKRALNRSEIGLNVDRDGEFRLPGRIQLRPDTALGAGDDEADLASIRAGDIAVRGADFIKRIVDRLARALTQPADQTVFLKIAIPAWTI